MSFFRPPWVIPPPGVEELDPTALAPGFAAGGAHCGLKKAGTDLGLISSEDEPVASAMLLTRNASAAAPVRLCRDGCDAGAIQACIVNSGNANAATGEQGMHDAEAMQEATAKALGIPNRAVAVAETGVIGVPLPIDAIVAAIPGVAAEIRADGGAEFSEAIMTTDRSPKRCCIRDGQVTISAQAKGAGMIEPGFATMLCFIQTDALLPNPEPPLREAVAESFERITVDGQMSTNDMVLIQASGSSGEPLREGVLEAILLQLALEIVADGEGASRVCRLEVTEARDEAEAERVARAIANSPLVQTALFGRDPNWGRIAQAAGMALAGEDIPELGPERIDASGLGTAKAEGEISVRLGRGDGRSHVYFSDLTHEYVTINAEYTT